MSSYKHHVITCPKCGAQGDFTAWDSVNVTIMPPLKEKVKTGELFRWTCPACGETFTVPYPVLYHDMEKKFMVYHLLKREEEETSGKMTAEELAKKSMNIMASRNFFNNGYTLRNTYSLDDFREKIAQLDSGLDDRAIEFLKYYLLYQNPDSNLPKDAVLRFSHAAEDKETGGVYLLFYIIHPSLPNQPFLQVSSNAYREIEKNADKLNDIFGNQGADYIEVSQYSIAKKLGLR